MYSDLRQMDLVREWLIIIPIYFSISMNTL